MREKWKHLTLGDFTSTINGLWKGKKPPYIEVDVYSMSNFTKESELDSNSKPRKITANEKQYQSRQLQNGDILIEKSGGGPKQPVGRAVLFNSLNGGNNSFSNFTTRLRIESEFQDQISSAYLHKYLKYIYISGETEKFQKHSTNIRNLQLKEYLRMKVPIPPLPEQKRIVAILDKAFEAIDQAVANVERNIQNAEELFQSKLNEILSQKGEGWEEKKLGDICELINGRAYKKNELLNGGKYLVLRVGNLFTNKKFYFSDLELEDKKYIENGDLIYAWSASFGPHFWYGDRAIFHYHIWKMVNDHSVVRKDFLYHLLDWDKEKIKSEKGTGTTMIHVSKRSMERRNFLLPPLPEQKRIVKILDEFKEQQIELLTSYEQKLRNLEELKKSLLQKAFSGELTANEPMVA